MKFRNVFQLLGFRGRSKHYGYSERLYQLSDGSEVRYSKWDHPEEVDKKVLQSHVDAFEGLLDKGDFVIDIGSHSGDSTLPMGIAVGPEGLALALEPNPFVYHVLERNARANRKIANIETIFAAASDHEGFMTFEYSDSGFCNGGRHENISVFSHGHAFKLEVFCIDLAKELKSVYCDYLPRLRFIKIDAEGFDLYVAKALLPIIRECRPVMKIEVFKKTTSAYRAELLQLFEDLQYEVFMIDEEPLGRGPKLTESNLSERGHYDILCVPANSTE